MFHFPKLLSAKHRIFLCIRVLLLNCVLCLACCYTDGRQITPSNLYSRICLVNNDKSRRLAENGNVPNFTFYGKCPNVKREKMLFVKGRIL